MTIIEKIIANHSKFDTVKPGDIVDIEIDVRAARDFGGPNVVKHFKQHNLSIDDVSKTFFTFDTNPTGSDQKYAVNQHVCRTFAREKGIKVYDINKLKPQIVQTINKSTGLNVGIGNISFNFSLIDGITLDLNKIYVKDHPSFSKGNFF